MLWKKIKELKGTYATYSKKKKNQGKYFFISLQTIIGIKSEKCFEISLLFCLRFSALFSERQFCQKIYESQYQFR